MDMLIAGGVIMVSGFLGLVIGAKLREVSEKKSEKTSVKN